MSMYSIFGGFPRAVNMALAKSFQVRALPEPKLYSPPYSFSVHGGHRSRLNRVLYVKEIAQLLAVPIFRLVGFEQSRIFPSLRICS